MLGSMINMDAPRHTKLRLLVNKGFTPKMVARIEDYVHDIARECVEDIAAKGSCDFVTEVAAPLPLRIICDMLGIPREDNQFIFDSTNHLLGGLDPEYNADGRGHARRRLEHVELRPGARREAAGRPAGRHHLRAHARRGRRPAADGAGVRLVLRAAVLGRQRDDPQRHRPRAAGSSPATPTSASS